MSRGYAPVAVVLLLALTVVAAGTVALFLPTLPGDPPPRRSVAVTASGDGTVRLTLLSGPPIDVGTLGVRVEVGGRALRYQPPVPYFAARGFHGAPTGPFNSADDSPWRVGETVSFRVAGTNHPVPAAGDALRVELRLRGSLVAVGETTVEPAGAEPSSRESNARASRTLESVGRPGQSNAPGFSPRPRALARR